MLKENNRNILMNMFHSILLYTLYDQNYFKSLIIMLLKTNTLLL